MDAGHVHSQDESVRAVTPSSGGFPQASITEPRARRLPRAVPTRAATGNSVRRDSSPTKATKAAQAPGGSTKPAHLKGTACRSRKPLVEEPQERRGDEAESSSGICRPARRCRNTDSDNGGQGRLVAERNPPCHRRHWCPNVRQ